MSIATKAMVLNLHVGIWTGHRFDREATRKAVEDAGADQDAARVNKHLVAREYLKPINSAANAIRGHLYEKTLPWKDNGDRLLTRALYMDFIDEHERLVGAFRDAVDKFLDQDYPTAVEQASFRMGALFKPEDYPRVSELRSKFYVGLDIDAITEAGDFRVELDADQIDTVRQSMEHAMEQRINRAMQDVWQRLFTVVERMHERLADEDAVFRNSLITNVSDLVAVLPGLNVLEDPKLAALCREVQKKLTGIDPDDLRQDKATRFEVAGEAKKIMERMGGFMNAFNTPDKQAA